MTAHVFTLRLLETGRLAGQAVICARAQYASVWWAGAALPDRRLAGIQQWLAVDRQLAEQLPPGPLDRLSLIGLLLAGDRTTDITIQYLYQDPLGDVGPTAIAAVLDQRLRALHS